MPYILLND